MKILIISTSVLPLGGKGYGGIEKLCLDFVEQLNNRGHDVSVAAPIGSKVPDGVRLIETVKLPEEQDRDDLSMFKYLKEGAGCGKGLVGKGGTWEVVHDFSHGHNLARWLGRGPIISMLWDPVVYKYGKAPYNIVCLSEWQKERFEKLYNQKAIVMPPLVNTDRYKPDPNAKRERFLFLGKISPEKGVHLAIEYAKELKVPLDVVGGLIPSEQNSQYLKMISNMVDRARYQENLDIQFYWNVSEEDKIKFLQNAKAVIYPVQQDEAHWLVGVEAWACGTPTIALDKGALLDINIGGWVGTEEYVKHIIRWIDESPKDFKQHNVKETTEKYGHESVIPQWENLYKEVASGKRW